MNTCGTCRFRGDEIVKEGWQEEDWKDKPTGFFLCTRIKHDRYWERLKGSHATVEDGSGYHAALCVENDFGCNLWEAQAVDAGPTPFRGRTTRREE